MLSSSKCLELKIGFSDSREQFVEFECNKNEIIALVGDGLNETSLILRSIAGLVLPKYGRINCFGETWLDTNTKINLAARFRRVGMVFNNYALFPHMRVIDNIMFSATKNKHNATRKFADKIISQLGIQGTEMSFPTQLLNSYKQRVAFARAFVRRPLVLLFESTSSNEYPTPLSKAGEYLKFCRDELNIPVVFSTKDKEAALEIADRRVFIVNNKSIQSI